MLEIILIAVGLSMDACAVSLGKGLNIKCFNAGHAFIIAAFFGVFQAVMPVIGWAVGVQFEHYIVEFDHWIAFIVLAFLGIKMIVDAVRGNDEGKSDTEEKLDIKELFILAIATSIDALVVGITFAFLQIDIVPAVITIGVVTFLLSYAGVFVGSRFGKAYGKPANIIGGIVLIGIGAKILLEHLGILG